MWTLIVIAATIFAVGYVAYKFPATWSWILSTSVAKVNEAADATKAKVNSVANTTVIK